MQPSIYLSRQAWQAADDKVYIQLKRKNNKLWSIMLPYDDSEANHPPQHANLTERI